MGRRIVDSSGRKPVRDGENREEENPLGQYWDRLKNLIPVEVTAIYIAGVGVIPLAEPPTGTEAVAKIGLLAWAIFCLGCTILYIAKETKTVAGFPEEILPIDWTHVAISSISFVIWVYALGGPFTLVNNLYISWVGTLLVLGWTFLTPYIYQGKKQ